MGVVGTSPKRNAIPIFFKLGAKNFKKKKKIIFLGPSSKEYSREIKMKITMYYYAAGAIFFLISIGYSTARPQIVREVIGAENKAAVLSEFGGISILRQSLPDFQLPQDFNVEVESQVLVLTKPKDRDAKRREKAEKRIQVPRTS